MSHEYYEYSVHVIQLIYHAICLCVFYVSAVSEITKRKARTRDNVHEIHLSVFLKL